MPNVKAEFIDMEPGSDCLSNISIDSVEQMSALLEESRPRHPFIFKLSRDGGYSATVGLARDVGFVQFSATSGDPPYLVAVSLACPALAPDRIRNPYAAAIEDAEQADVVPIEFICGGTATPIPSRCIVPFELMRQIVIHFMKTGERYPNVRWEEI